MQGFEYSYFIALFCHISGKWKSCRTWADNRYFDAILFGYLRDGYLSAFAFVISSEAFQIANGNGFVSGFQMCTLWFALFFLRTNAATYSRQCTGLFQCFCCFEKFSSFNVFNEFRNVDSHRTTVHTGRIGTIQATFGFRYGLFFIQPQVDFLFTAMWTVFSIQFIHLDTRNGHTFLGFHRFAQFCTPRGIASIKFFGRFACFGLFICIQFMNFFSFNLFESSHTF